MPPTRKFGRLNGLLAAASLTLLVGCDEPVEEERVAVYIVRGQVMYQGAPVAGADVTFFPQQHAGAPTPRGSTDAEGKFQLTTYERHDGAPAGAYRVCVACFEIGEDVKREDRDEAPNKLPAAYAKPDTTPLKVTVAPAENQLPAFELPP